MCECYQDLEPSYCKQQKLDYTLLSYEALEEAVKVMQGNGAEKHGRDSWKKETLQKQLESAQRHLAELIKGNLYDSESKLTHAAHLMCRAMFATYLITNTKWKENI